MSGDDAENRIRRLAAKARNPLRCDLLGKLGVSSLDLHTAAVCVYHEVIHAATQTLVGS